jgi:hypothetical protein
MPFIYGAFKAIEWRWWVDGVRFGEVRFESNLPASGLFGLYWKVVGWGVLFVIGFSLWIAAVAAIAYGVGGVAGTTQQKMFMTWQQLPVLFAFGLSYVALALAIGAVRRVYLIRDMWQRVADSVTIHNLAAADNVTAQGELVSALGEGFADSLDVVGF